MKQDITSRLEAMRKMMTQAGIDAVIIPQTDPHQSEYIASHWQVRRWLSGFTGSAGSLVVTATKALLWTDSRYFIQAADQLKDTSIELMKEGLPGTPDILDYLIANLVQGSTVGIDGLLFSATSCGKMADTLSRAGLKLRCDFDPIDALWADRPALPQAEVIIHNEKYAGESASSKTVRILEKADAQGANAVLISALDEIAWTLNIRSRDVNCNPVATAYLYLAPEGSYLLIDKAKITPEVDKYLADNGVATKDYTDIINFTSNLPDTSRVLIDPAKTSITLTNALGDKAIRGTVPVAMMKACKNEVQISGTRAAMERDGVAMVRALMAIEHAMASGEKLTEMSIAELLTDLRSKQDLYFDNSFETIAGFRSHGAIVHYEATPATDVTLEPDGLLLIDSGAQYLDGTTDITRTITLGNPTPQQRHDFTLVMKGHIALGSMIFPEGTTGHQLDAIARQYLWKEGLTYLHGTGHGVGHFLNVHEGPQSIRLNHVPTPLTPGMITSNEPGLYREGIHGIRCENLVLTVNAMTTEFGNFYRFETLTLCPFDLRLFDTTIMTDDEIAWLNDYHAQVRQRLSPLLTDEERKWLETNTQPLKR
ncbi:MAG: aminopeptidase P family protein [Muribaculaceae bacterium]|nr:aminopeptidase P family protein [Muribaculaceae bacterium]